TGTDGGAYLDQATVQTNESNTSLSQNTTTGVISYVAEDGLTDTANVTSTDPTNILTTGTDGGAYLDQATVQTNETLTSIIQNNSTGVITYVAEDGGNTTLDVRRANFMPNGDNTYTLTDDYNVSRTDIPSTAYVDNLIGFNVDPDMNFPHPMNVDNDIATIDEFDLTSIRILAYNLFYINFPGPPGNSFQISKLKIKVADLTLSDKGKIIKLVENGNITNGNGSAPPTGSTSGWKKFKEILIYDEDGTTDILNGGILNPTNHIYYETVQLYWDGSKWLPFK
ncbi:MAG: hypothetical protein ACPF9U_07465, partial [Flavobacteriaceae bacterium]